MKVINSSNQKLIADNVKVADNFFSRLIGLLNRSCLAENEGLWLVPCESIHSFGMKFNFDAVFLDKSGKVIALTRNIQPNKIVPSVKNTYSVLELASGTIEKAEINTGNILKFEQ